MDGSHLSKRRLVAVAVIAASILLALVIAAGGLTLSSPSSVSAVTPNVATNAPATAAPPSGRVQGVVTARVQHLKGPTWRFLYTVANNGKQPIAGFQVTGSSAHLFHVVGPSWSYYGTGVCHKTGPAGLLIYWSTNDAQSMIGPGKSLTLGFDANTTGPVSGGYAISYGTAVPQSGSVQAPAKSNLPPGVPCT